MCEGLHVLQFNLLDGIGGKMQMETFFLYPHKLRYNAFNCERHKIQDISRHLSHTRSKMH